MRFRDKRNTQIELVEHLLKYPCQTERELVEGLWDSKYRDKKHADLLRRAMRSGKVDRVRVKFKGKDKRMVFYYFIPGTTAIK